MPLLLLIWHIIAITITIDMAYYYCIYAIFLAPVTNRLVIPCERRYSCYNLNSDSPIFVLQENAIHLPLLSFPFLGEPFKIYTVMERSILNHISCKHRFSDLHFKSQYIPPPYISIAVYIYTSHIYIYTCVPLCFNMFHFFG